MRIHGILLVLLGLASAASAQRRVDTDAPLAPEVTRRIAADPAVRQLVGDREVLAASALSDKPDQRGGARALLSLTLAARDRSSAERVLFDARTGEVVKRTPFDARLLPIRDAELADALTFARRDPRVRALLGAAADRFVLLGAGVPVRPFTAQALPVRSTDARDPCTRGRCVDLIFRGERGYLSGTRVTVDLATRRVDVVQQEDHHAM